MPRVGNSSSSRSLRPTSVGKSTARDKLLASAMQIMLEKGFNGTTVDEICGHAGVSKGSCYHFFASKTDLGLAALELYYELGMKRLMTGAFNDEKDPMKRLIGFLKNAEARAEEFWGGGCLLGTFAVDLAGTNPAIRDRVAEKLDQIARGLAPWFEPASDNASGLSTTGYDLAMNYLNVIEGSIVMARAFNDPGRIRNGLESFRRQLFAGRHAVGLD